MDQSEKKSKRRRCLTLKLESVLTTGSAMQSILDLVWVFSIPFLNNEEDFLVVLGSF